MVRLNQENAENSQRELMAQQQQQYHHRGTAPPPMRAIPPAMRIRNPAPHNFPTQQPLSPYQVRSAPTYPPENRIPPYPYYTPQSQNYTHQQMLAQQHMSQRPSNYEYRHTYPQPMVPHPFPPYSPIDVPSSTSSSRCSSRRGRIAQRRTSNGSRSRNLEPIQVLPELPPMPSRSQMNFHGGISMGNPHVIDQQNRMDTVTVDLTGDVVMEDRRFVPSPAPQHQWTPMDHQYSRPEPVRTCPYGTPTRAPAPCLAPPVVYQPVPPRTVLGTMEIIRTFKGKSSNSPSLFTALPMPSGEIFTVYHTMQILSIEPPRTGATTYLALPWSPASSVQSPPAQPGDADEIIDVTTVSDEPEPVAEPAAFLQSEPNGAVNLSTRRDEQGSGFFERPAEGSGRREDSSDKCDPEVIRGGEPKRYYGRSRGPPKPEVVCPRDGARNVFAESAQGSAPSTSRPLSYAERVRFGRPEDAGPPTSRGAAGRDSRSGGPFSAPPAGSRDPVHGVFATLRGPDGVVHGDRRLLVSGTPRPTVIHQPPQPPRD